MKTRIAALAAAATVTIAATGIAANADFYPIPTPKITCLKDLSRLQVVNGDLQFTATLAIGGVKPEGKTQHFTYAQYVDVKVGRDGTRVRYPLEITSYVKNTEKCVIAKLSAPTIGYRHEQRAIVRLYSSTGDWAETDIYRRLRSR